MTTPQMDIFREGSRHHHFLEYDLATGWTAAKLAKAIKQARAAASKSPCAMVVAVSKSTLAKLMPGEMPDGMHDFVPLEGPKHSAPATQSDVWFWVHGAERDDVFDLVRAIDGAITGIARLELDLSGFMYHDARDMTGFVDGSANAKGDKRLEQGLVPAGKMGAGGAFVLGQRWVHDLDAFAKLSQHDQEQVFGRTKPDSIELEGDALPAWSHVGRTDLKIDGVGQKMYRRSAPYGGVGEHGLYFLGFTSDIGHFDSVLKSMYGLSGDGEYDHLTDFSEAKTGSYWFAPSATALDKL
jgi:putative iron-dependent peroxidase